VGCAGRHLLTCEAVRPTRGASPSIDSGSKGGRNRRWPMQVATRSPRPPRIADGSEQALSATPNVHNTGLTSGQFLPRMGRYCGIIDSCLTARPRCQQASLSRATTCGYPVRAKPCAPFLDRFAPDHLLAAARSQRGTSGPR